MICIFYTSYDEHNKCRLFSWSEINYILCFIKIILHEHISNWNHYYGVSFMFLYAVQPKIGPTFLER